MEANEIKVGQRVVYYNIIKEDGTKIDPKIVYIDSEPWEVGGQMVCKVVGIRGGVSIKHLDLLPESKWKGLKFENEFYYKAFERTLNREYLKVTSRTHDDCQWIVIEKETREVLQTYSGSQWLIGLRLDQSPKGYLVIVINDCEHLITDFLLEDYIVVPEGVDYDFQNETLVYTDYCLDDSLEKREYTHAFTEICGLFDADDIAEVKCYGREGEDVILGLKISRIKDCVNGFKGISHPLKMRNTWDSIKHLELDAYQNCRNDLDRALELLRSVEYDNPEIKDFVKSFDIPEESKTEEGAK